MLQSKLMVKAAPLLQTQQRSVQKPFHTSEQNSFKKYFSSRRTAQEVDTTKSQGLYKMKKKDQSDEPNVLKNKESSETKENNQVHEKRLKKSDKPDKDGGCKKLGVVDNKGEKSELDEKIKEVSEKISKLTNIDAQSIMDFLKGTMTELQEDVTKVTDLLIKGISGVTETSSADINAEIKNLIEKMLGNTEATEAQSQGNEESGKIAVAAITDDIELTEEEMKQILEKFNLKIKDKEATKGQDAEKQSFSLKVKSTDGDSGPPTKLQDKEEQAKAPNKLATAEEEKARGREKVQDNNNLVERIKVSSTNESKNQDFTKITFSQQSQDGVTLSKSELVPEPLKFSKPFIMPEKEAILKQVIDNASMKLTPDKAEMVINLKPDNLGKLELKLTTERGMLTAQITAENQQVKQIIESNFNVLRDALEKQGIGVQQFSVSVGQQNKEFQQGWKNSSNSHSDSNSRYNRVSGYSSEILGYETDVKGNVKDYWPNSTVNYTA